MSMPQVQGLRERLHEALIGSDLASHEASVLAAAEPYLVLQTPREDQLEDRLPSGASRFGFVPDLPPGLEWPAFEGKKLMFLAQIDFAAMPRWSESPLPASGWLYVFVLFPEQQSAQTPWRSVVFHHAGPREALVRMNEPSLEDVWLIGNTDRSTEELLSLTGRIGLMMDPSRLDKEAQSAMYDLEEVVDAVSPRYAKDSDPIQPVGYVLGQMPEIDGTPAQTVNDLMRSRVDAAAQQLADQSSGPGEDWILLLAIYSAGTMQWSDAGYLYLLIRRNDLARGDFSRICMTISSG